MSMFSDPDFLLLYDKHKSFLWNFRKEILDNFQLVISSKDFGLVTGKNIESYQEYMKIRDQSSNISLKKS